MTSDQYRVIGPLAYAGKKDCTSGLCRSMPNPEGGWTCIGWHCSYCDEPTGSQGHRCDASEAILGEASRIASERPPSASEGDA